MNEPTGWLEPTNWKDRAEAAEASARDGWGQRDAIYAELVKVQARAEAAEKREAHLLVLLKEARRFYPPFDQDVRTRIILSEINAVLEAKP